MKRIDLEHRDKETQVAIRVVFDGKGGRINQAILREDNDKRALIAFGFFSKEDAQFKLSERQNTFTLEKCIKKHGDALGREIYEKRQLKWQNTLKSKTNIKKLETVFKLINLIN